MARVKDPVCGMIIESDTAAAKSTYQGETYFFCSVDCKQAFDAEPSRFAAAKRADAPEGDAPRTEAGGIVAPKFGSAGSGGAEYERLPTDLPDRSDRDAR
jgi:Cu+-exporting ATPase